MNNNEKLLVGTFKENHYNRLVDRQKSLELLDIKTYSILENKEFKLYVDFSTTKTNLEDTKIILYRNGYQFS